jgi:putative sterol carrier protein
LDAVFQYKLSGSGGGEWHLIVKDGELEIVEGLHKSPTTTIMMSGQDFVAFIEGKLNAMQAYTSGKLKIEGDVAKSQLLQKMFKI